MPINSVLANPSNNFAVDALAGGTGLYTILRLLPEDAGEFQYDIQRADGGEHRLARESQLRSASPPAPPPRRSNPPGRIGGSPRRVR